ncbi:hypothetical protein EJ110_NYTH37341 [Nymphaea thermarum]|nr:hypothetical protein EJ110_NYTH37341 [Nymphaea thermarum]
METEPRSLKPRWRCFTYDEIFYATNSCHPDNLVGTGGYAEVYRGQLHDGKVIAVKRLTKNDGVKTANCLNGQSDSRSQLELHEDCSIFINAASGGSLTGISRHPISFLDKDFEPQVILKIQGFKIFQGSSIVFSHST